MFPLSFFSRFFLLRTERRDSVRGFVIFEPHGCGAKRIKVVRVLKVRCGFVEGNIAWRGYGSNRNGTVKMRN